MTESDRARAAFWRALAKRDKVSETIQELGNSLFGLTRILDPRTSDRDITQAERTEELSLLFELAHLVSAVATGGESTPPGTALAKWAEWGRKWKLTEAWCFFGVLIVRHNAVAVVRWIPWNEAAEHGFDDWSRVKRDAKPYIELLKAGPQKALPPLLRIGELEGRKVLRCDRLGGGLFFPTPFCPIGTRWEEHKRELKAEFESHLELLKLEHRARVKVDPPVFIEQMHAEWFVRHFLEGETLSSISKEITSQERKRVSEAPIPAVRKFAVRVGLNLKSRRGRPPKNRT